MATKTKAEANGQADELPVNRVARTPGVKRVRVTIRGLPPGLLYQGKGVMEADGGDGKKTKPRSAAEEADLRAHWLGSGKGRQLCIPWVMLYKSFCSAAGSFKYRKQKSMTTVVAATISCEVDRVPLGTADYEVFEEWCRIPPRTGAMVKIGRPRVRVWEATFVMVVDDEMYDIAGLESIIRHAGKLIGIGAWRPELKGPHGRFEVVWFEVL